MKITCPDCSTQYSVKDDAIGPNGRTVRCSNCSATWFVSDVAETLELIDNQNDTITAAEAATEVPIIEPSGRGSIPEADGPAAMGAHVHMRDRVDQQRRNRRLMGVSMIWIVTIAILAAAAILAILFKQDVVDRSPAMSSFYRAVGIPVKVNGLDFEHPATRYAEIDGQYTLVVNGVVINRSNQTQKLPFVELWFASKSGAVLAKWIVELDAEYLPPRERIEYVTQYPNPPVDAAELKYKFVTDGPAVSTPEASDVLGGEDTP